MIAIGNFTRSSSFRVGALLTSLAVAAIIFIVYFWRIASSDVFLREAKAAVNAAKARLTAADATIEATRSQYYSALAAVNAANATIAQIESEMNDMVLKAPRSGRIFFSPFSQSALPERNSTPRSRHSNCPSTFG